MMKKILTVLLVMVLSVTLTSCFVFKMGDKKSKKNDKEKEITEKEKKSSKDDEEEDEEEETKKSSDEKEKKSKKPEKKAEKDEESDNDKKEKPGEKIRDKEKPEDKENIDIDLYGTHRLEVTDEMFEAYTDKACDYLGNQPYFDYDSCEIGFAFYDDFNNDNRAEGLIYVQDMDHFIRALLLDVESEEAQLLDELILLDYTDDDTNDIIYDLVGYVDIDGRSHPMAFLYVNPNPNLEQFDLYDLTYNSFNPFVKTIGGSDVGAAQLIDVDEDEDYDGYMLEQWGYDVFYYPLTTTVMFDGGILVHDSGYIELYDYPEDPEEVVREFAFLSYIRDINRNMVGEFTDIDNLDERLEELCINGFDERYILPYKLLEGAAIGIEPRMAFYEDIKGPKAKVTTEIIGDYWVSDTLYEYELEKIDGRWVIVSQDYVE